jgi:hypothetical protein
MQDQSRFELKAAIENWRQELAAQRSLSPDARRELEAHLQDAFADLRGRGLNEEESFMLARKRIGELPLLNREFKIAMKTMRHPERPAAIAAWAIFVIAFFLPALDEVPGWKAAILQNLAWQSALAGDWMSIHYLLLTLANLLMIGSPFLLAWAGQDERFLKWLRGLSLAAVVLVWSYVFEFAAHNLGAPSNSILSMGGLKIGCYLWALSCVFLCLASFLQTTATKSSVSQSA